MLFTRKSLLQLLQEYLGILFYLYFYSPERSLELPRCMVKFHGIIKKVTSVAKFVHLCAEEVILRRTISIGDIADNFD